MVKVVTRQCKCWPNSIGVDQDHVPENKVRLACKTYKAYEFCQSLKNRRLMKKIFCPIQEGLIIFNFKRLENCNFISHANCVAPLVSNFKQQVITGYTLFLLKIVKNIKT